MSISIESHHEMSPDLLDALVAMEQCIFERPYARGKIQRELETRHRMLALVAKWEDQLCGFKVGYELSAQVFYSWIGGVVPEYRRHQVATQLMHRQHEQIAAMGYATVRTHTENRFRAMLILNLECGFDIVGTKMDSDSRQPTIILEKRLSS